MINTIISVVMPVYNGEMFLRKAIQSILNQTYQNFEFIIINDGSSDRSKEIILSFLDSRILFIDQKNVGLSKTLNNGIRISKGEFIAIMDQDDISFPDRLYTQINYLNRNSNVSVISGALEYIDNNDKVLGRSFSINIKFLINTYLRRFGSVICQPAAMIRKKDLITVGCYSEKIDHKFTDYNLWLKFINNNFEVMNLKKTLIQYRISENSISSSYSISEKNIKQLIGLLSSESPNNTTINDLINYDNNFRKRFDRFKNFENILYKYFKKCINENLLVYIITGFKNNILYIKFKLQNTLYKIYTNEK